MLSIPTQAEAGVLRAILASMGKKSRKALSSQALARFSGRPSKFWQHVESLRARKPLRKTSDRALIEVQDQAAVKLLKPYLARLETGAWSADMVAVGALIEAELADDPCPVLPWSVEELAARIDVPPAGTLSALQQLAREGYLTPGAGRAGWRASRVLKWPSTDIEVRHVDRSDILNEGDSAAVDVTDVPATIPVPVAGRAESGAGAQGGECTPLIISTPRWLLDSKRITLGALKRPSGLSDEDWVLHLAVVAARISQGTLTSRKKAQQHAEQRSAEAEAQVTELVGRLTEAQEAIVARKDAAGLPSEAASKLQMRLDAEVAKVAELRSVRDKLVSKVVHLERLIDEANAERKDAATRTPPPPPPPAPQASDVRDRLRQKLQERVIAKILEDEGQLDKLAERLLQGDVEHPLLKAAAEGLL